MEYEVLPKVRGRRTCTAEKTLLAECALRDVVLRMHSGEAGIAMLLRYAVGCSTAWRAEQILACGRKSLYVQLRNARDSWGLRDECLWMWLWDTRTILFVVYHDGKSGIDERRRQGEFCLRFARLFSCAALVVGLGCAYEFGPFDCDRWECDTFWYGIGMQLHHEVRYWPASRLKALQWDATVHWTFPAEFRSVVECVVMVWVLSNEAVLHTLSMEVLLLCFEHLWDLEIFGMLHKRRHVPQGGEATLHCAAQIVFDSMVMMTEVPEVPEEPPCLSQSDEWDWSD